LGAGNHELKVEYYEHGGAANVSLTWESIGAGGNANLVLNRTAYATSQQNVSFVSAKANDGNSGTRWSSRVGQDVSTEWWWVDLGGQSFDTVVIRWEAAYAQNYYIAWSDDCVNYYGFYYEGGGEGIYRYPMYGIRSGACLAVVLVGRSPSMQNYSMWEVEAYLGTPAESVDQIQMEQHTQPLNNLPISLPIKLNKFVDHDLPPNGD